MVSLKILKRKAGDFMQLDLEDFWKFVILFLCALVLGGVIMLVRINNKLAAEQLTELSQLQTQANQLKQSQAWEQWEIDNWNK